MSVLTRLDLYRAFDETSYLERYPDIRSAIEKGVEASAWHHFDRHGLMEGRSYVDFDAEFYMRSYPQAATDIQAGLASHPLHHYVLYGRGYGYLPNPKARRPDYPAAIPSRFGGLWIDSLDAPARIDGRLETGQISRRQAVLLRNFIRDGYVVIENAVDPATVEEALVEFDAAYAGKYDRLLFECNEVSPGKHTAWRPELNDHPAKALDLHHFSRAIRNLIFAPRVTEFLALIFEAKALASQTLGFLRGSAQEGHQDSAYVPYTLARGFSASWIALEDVTIGAGELFYYVGSHRLADFLYDGAFKCVSEARRINGEAEYRPQVERHVESLVRRAEEMGLRKEVFAAKKGDALIWHADLVHGGNPVSREITRKSVVTHYCPKYCVPLFAEGRGLRFHEHQGHMYTSGNYGTTDPVW